MLQSCPIDAPLKPSLVGFMGCGKSSVGRLAAKDLGFEFMDTDALVERAGISISEIRH